MWRGGVVFIVSVVSVLGLRESIAQDKGSRSEQRPVFYIYPHTGRLFHADYVRDNQIFQSLERTNFMRRGLFANRQKREEEEKKKHVYFELGRFTSEDMKKSVLGKSKVGLFKENTVKGTEYKFKEETRRKRQVDRTEDHQTTSTQSTTKEVEIAQVLNHTKSDQLNSTDLRMEDLLSNQNNSTPELGSNVPEKMVDGDFVIHPKCNDSDKTLLIRDPKPDQSEALKAVALNSPILNYEGLMKKIVMDDGMMLYPIYRGDASHYPTERRLIYSPQLTVQMDLPEVQEYIPAASADNFTTESEQEGRSKRPLKKLALPLLLALKLKTAIMLPLILGLVSLVALKGLWSGLTALGISVALGLKALVTSSAPRVVVQSHPPPPPPHIHHFPPHEYTEYWSRSDNNNYYNNDYRPNSWT